MKIFSEAYNPNMPVYNRFIKKAIAKSQQLHGSAYGYVARKNEIKNKIKGLSSTDRLKLRYESIKVDLYDLFSFNRDELSNAISNMLTTVTYDMNFLQASNLTEEIVLGTVMGRAASVIETAKNANREASNYLKHGGDIDEEELVNIITEEIKNSMISPRSGFDDLKDKLNELTEPKVLAQIKRADPGLYKTIREMKKDIISNETRNIIDKKSGRNYVVSKDDDKGSIKFKIPIRETTMNRKGESYTYDKSSLTFTLTEGVVSDIYEVVYRIYEAHEKYVKNK